MNIFKETSPMNFLMLAIITNDVLHLENKDEPNNLLL